MAEVNIRELYQEINESKNKITFIRMAFKTFCSISPIPFCLTKNIKILYIDLREGRKSRDTLTLYYFKALVSFLKTSLYIFLYQDVKQLNQFMFCLFIKPGSVL